MFNKDAGVKLVQFQHCRATVQSDPPTHNHTVRVRHFGSISKSICHGQVFFVMVRYVVGWVVVFAIRLIPFRPANVEPLMATLMPYSKKYGWLGGFAFAFLGMALFDVATGKVGLWTWITAGTYGMIGIGAYFFFRSRPSSARNYVTYSIIGTLVFDAITGLGIGPIFYGQPFMEALVGQIPFTLKHLLGNVVLALFVSPAIYRWVVENPKLETKLLWNRVWGHDTLNS